MKKRYKIWIFTAILVLTLTACGGCKHEWQKASCELPKTCSLCGETEAEALGHSWTEADCENPKICSLCGETEGEALDHDWQEATCENPQICAVCGVVQGEKNPHAFAKWIIVGEEMTRSCAVCEAEETAPLDHNEIIKDMLLGEWKSCTMEIGFSGKKIQTDYSICFYEDGAYVFQEEQTWTGTWELVRVNLPYYTVELYCNEKMQESQEEKEESNYICLIEMWENYEFVNMDESENGSLKQYVFVRDDAQAQKESMEWLVGTWTSEMVGRMDSAGFQETRTIETGYTITAHENGEITFSMNGEKCGIWIYAGKYVENPGSSAERIGYFYTVLGEDFQDAIDISVRDGQLQFHQLEENTPYYYYFGQMTAQEQKQFLKGPELLPGVWKSTLVEIYDTQTQTDITPEKTDYTLNITSNGRFSSNIPGISNGDWAYDGYDSEEGYQYLLMPDNSNYYWYLLTLQNGKLETFIWDGDHFITVHLEMDS